MKQLTDAERLEIVLAMLNEQQVDEYVQRCADLEHQPERNGFHNTPAECENRECADCDIGDDARLDIDCPYTL